MDAGFHWRVLRSCVVSCTVATFLDHALDKQRFRIISNDMASALYQCDLIVISQRLTHQRLPCILTHLLLSVILVSNLPCLTLRSHGETLRRQRGPSPWSLY